MSILEEDFRELSLRLSPELSQLNGKSILLVGATGAISSYLGRFLINVLHFFLFFYEVFCAKFYLNGLRRKQIS